MHNDRGLTRISAGCILSSIIALADISHSLESAVGLPVYIGDLREPLHQLCWFDIQREEKRDTSNKSDPRKVTHLFDRSDSRIQRVTERHSSIRDDGIPVMSFDGNMDSPLAAVWTTDGVSSFETCYVFNTLV